MRKDLISKATRNAFRDALSGFVLREIDTIFEGADMSPKSDHEPQVAGQRRSLVEQYYANVDFTSPSDTAHVISAYEEVLLKLQRSQSSDAEGIFNDR